MVPQPGTNSIKRQLYCEWNRCVHCGTCGAVCGQRVHEMDEGAHRIRFSGCALCGACVEACPQGALGVYGRERSAGEVVAEVMKDYDYYEDSGGGVTISGGEPMAQADYAWELSGALKGAGLHVCMETSGFAPWEAYQRLLPDVDLFLFDYKATGEELHRRLTGRGPRPDPHESAAAFRSGEKCTAALSDHTRLQPFGGTSAGHRGPEQVGSLCR